MKYTEIDGKRYEIEKCEDCPFMDNGDSGYCAHCNHPAKKDYIDLEYISYTSYKNPEGMIHEDCPLRDLHSCQDVSYQPDKPFEMQKPEIPNLREEVRQGLLKVETAYHLLGAYLCQFMKDGFDPDAYYSPCENRLYNLYEMFGFSREEMQAEGYKRAKEIWEKIE